MDYYLITDFVIEMDYYLVIDLEELKQNIIQKVISSSNQNYQNYENEEKI